MNYSTKKFLLNSFLVLFLCMSFIFIFASFHLYMESRLEKSNSIYFDQQNLKIIFKQHALEKVGKKTYEGVGFNEKDGYYELTFFKLKKEYEVFNYDDKFADVLSLEFSFKDGKNNISDCQDFIIYLPKNFIGLKKEDGVFVKKRTAKEYCRILEKEGKFELGFNVDDIETLMYSKN